MTSKWFASCSLGAAWSGLRVRESDLFGVIDGLRARLDSERPTRWASTLVHNLFNCQRLDPFKLFAGAAWVTEQGVTVAPSHPHWRFNLAAAVDLIPTQAIHAGIGESVVGEPGDVLQANLGSCVGIVLWDVKTGRFALAHVLLPRPRSIEDLRCSRYASTAVPHLASLLGLSEKPRKVHAVIAGGAAMYSQGGGIGATNVEAGLCGLREASIPLYKSDVGGNVGRRLIVDCTVRKVHVVRLAEVETTETWDLSPLSPRSLREQLAATAS